MAAIIVPGRREGGVDIVKQIARLFLCINGIEVVVAAEDDSFSATEASIG